jgi:hypothetical protein
MVVSDGLVESIKVRHVGNIIDNVIHGSARILENAPVIERTITRWQGINLSQQEQIILAQSAHTLRFPEGSPVTPEQLLRSRRADDNGSSLWNTFNRIQEHAVKGGDRAYDQESNRRVRSREVKSISGNVNLNKALWQLAESMAKLKS